MNISAVVITKNEESSIERCLKSVLFCQEIIIIDDNSTDKTIELAKKYKATVYTKTMNNNFADQRNFGITKANGEWILFIDADEELSNELQKEIQETLSSPDDNVKGYSLKRRDIFWNNELKYGEVQKVRNNGLIRLAKKGSGIWKGKVHEVVDGEGDIKLLKGYINHFPHQDIKTFLKKKNDDVDQF